MVCSNTCHCKDCIENIADYVARYKDTEIDFSTMIEVSNPHDSFSFLQGFLEACRLFGTWNGGERYIGACGIKVKDIQNQISKFMKQEI